VGDTWLSPISLTNIIEIKRKVGLLIHYISQILGFGVASWGWMAAIFDAVHSLLVSVHDGAHSAGTRP